jgi:hypothetical protein
MISEALSDATDEYRSHWQMLIKHIRSTADARNQIAHGDPVHSTGTIDVEVREGFQVKSVKQVGQDRMELHKTTKTSRIIWTTELLKAEFVHADKLFGHLIAFVHRLKGENVPEHLEEPFDPPSSKLGSDSEPQATLSKP